MIVIDFMVYIKKTKAKNHRAKTFDDFCLKVQGMILNLGKNSHIIDIVFYMYLKNSIKASIKKFIKGQQYQFQHL